MDDEFSDLVFDTSAPTMPQDERSLPTRPLLFSDGAPMCKSLSKGGFQCLRLTVKTRLIEQPQGNTHYWASGEMAWWFYAARVVLEHLHGVLTSPRPFAKSYIYLLCLSGPWRCGPWKSDATWLSRVIHHSYGCVEGSFLHPYAPWIDKHLMDRRDFLRFDIFLLQCWSQMEMDSARKRTVDTISFINEQPPEVCFYVLDRYMERVAPSPYRRGPDEPSASDRRTAYPRADLDAWSDLHPDLDAGHRVSFTEYACHLAKELALELKAVQVLVRSWLLPPERVSSLFQKRCVFMQTRLDSYIDCFIAFAQRQLEI
ncbi:hypothetical protein KVR01_012499 [Diaporthe batatas]|uniref:uncharacterized protein n=1 Tax=Diaporthe batatas TaxID=748121 RepID=UPI001D0559C8|nr:uncharacterized protein KVR01_012499 [Diaporthe batatas]KAG8157837.1 hypothetical protein KVR01_012499 [Diaporthe batatas]